MFGLIFLGKSDLNISNIIKIKDISQIKDTKPDDIVQIDYDIKFMRYLSNNDIDFIVKIQNRKELLYSNAIKANYILVDKSIAKKCQDIADNYMFDSKIIVLICDDNQLENMADIGIDGVLFE